MKFRICGLEVPSCVRGGTRIACGPRFDPSDPTWGGLFDGFEWAGEDPLGWLSERGWLCPLLRDAVLALRASVFDAFGVQPEFALSVEWVHGRYADAVLHVFAPVRDTGAGYSPEVHAEEDAFRFGGDGAPPPHESALTALMRADFDGAHEVGIHTEIHLSTTPLVYGPLRERTYPAALSVRNVKLKGDPIPDAAFRAASADLQVYRTIEPAIQRESKGVRKC